MVNAIDIARLSDASDPVSQDLRDAYPELDFLFDRLDDYAQFDLSPAEMQKKIEDLTDKADRYDVAVYNLMDSALQVMRSKRIRDARPIAQEALRVARFNGFQLPTEE